MRTVSPRGADDILSSLAAETGGLYFSRTTGFRRVGEVSFARGSGQPGVMPRAYRLTLVGERAAESGVLQVRVPGCSGCIVLPALNSTPE